MKADGISAEAWRDLVDRLAVYDVRYLLGGSDWDREASPYASPDDVPLAPLLLDMARSPSAHMRDALVALFLRHPEIAPLAELTAREPTTDDEARETIRIRVLVAAALQSEWSFALGIHLSNQTRIEADQLAVEFDLPSPSLDFGRPCLAAAARRLRQGKPFPFNYEEDWENAARRLLAQLAREAPPHVA